MNTPTRHKLVVPLAMLTIFAASIASAQLPRLHHAPRRHAVARTPAPLTAPSSVQVWVNTKTGVYHYPGERWYGRTRSGQMMSEDAARKAGYRATGNGQ